MPRQAWTALVNDGYPGVLADGSPLASSVTETIISPSAPDLTIPANYLLPGQILRVTAAGKYSTTSAPTLEIRLRIGGVAGTLLLDTGAATSISGAANTTWRFESEIEVRAIGASGSLFPIGRINGLTAVAAFALIPATAPAAVTVDTTAAKALVLTGQWGTNSNLNTITCNYFLVEQLN